mgnify:CR=1 FL=1|jgi:hypothetical protein
MILSTLLLAFALTIADILPTRANARGSDQSNMADFVDFQTFELDGEIDFMMWCGAQDETVLVKTDDGSIYRSRDRGSNWKRLRSLMTKQGSTVADGD